MLSASLGAPGPSTRERIIELTAYVEREVAAGAQGEDRPVCDGLGRDEALDRAGVLDASPCVRHLLGQLALGADGELLDLAPWVDLADADHRVVAPAGVGVGVGPEGSDLDEGDIEAHLGKPDDAGGGDR